MVSPQFGMNFTEKMLPWWAVGKSTIRLRRKGDQIMTWLSSEADASRLYVRNVYILQFIIKRYQVEDLDLHIYLPLLFHSRELTHPSCPSSIQSRSSRRINCGALWRRLRSNLSVSKYERFPTSWVVDFENIFFRFILWLVVVTSVDTPGIYLSGSVPPKTNLIFTQLRKVF